MEHLFVKPLRIITDGDSLTDVAQLEGKTWPHYLMMEWLTNRSNAIFATNAARGWRTLVEVLGYYPTYIRPFAPDAETNAMYLCLAGINDIWMMVYNQSTNTIEQVEVAHDELMTLANADGFLTVAFTLPYGYWTAHYDLNPERIHFNEHVLQSRTAHYVVRLDKRFPKYMEKFFSDVHPLTNGHALIAADVIVAINQIARTYDSSVDIEVGNLIVERGAMFRNGETKYQASTDTNHVNIKIMGTSGGQSADLLQIWNGNILSGRIDGGHVLKPKAVDAQYYVGIENGIRLGADLTAARPVGFYAINFSLQVVSGNDRMWNYDSSGSLWSVNNTNQAITATGGFFP